MRRYLFLILAAGIVCVGLTLSQTFHDLLPHTGEGADSLPHHSTAGQPGSYRRISPHHSLPNTADDAYEPYHGRNSHSSDRVYDSGSKYDRHSYGVASKRKEEEDDEQEENHEQDQEDEPVTEHEDESEEVDEEPVSHKEKFSSDRLYTSPLSKTSKKSTTQHVAVDSEDESEAEEDAADGDGGCVDSQCGKHGRCRNGKCKCTVFYTGKDCKTPIDLPLSMKRKPFKGLTSKFEGELTLNKKALRKRKNLMVHLPGKEHEADKGYRVLAEGSLMDQIIDIIPDEDQLGSKFFDTCAIIGSSGILLNYEDGKDIDSHDMVMRFNSAPTKGFEKHVGKKTTHRITNTQNWGFKESDNEALLIHFRAASAIKGLFWNAKQKKPNKLYAFDPDLVQYIAFGLDFLATSGLYGILIAMQRCARVDLYGFQVSTAHGTLYHYYDVCDIPANLGRDSDEYVAVSSMAEAGLVHFMEPCVIECHQSKEACSKCKSDTGFVSVKLPSDSKCDPNRVSRGHQEVPWRRERHKKKPH